MTWYHLSFLAVSIAMFGMAGGAVHVYLREEAFSGANAPGALARHATRFALSIPASHILNLCIPIQVASSPTAIAGLAAATATLAVPFYLSGIVVATALTRIPAPSGLVYGVDLMGAALGCLLIVPVLDATSITGAAFACGAIAAAGAVCLHRFAGSGTGSSAVVLLVLWGLAAGLNDVGDRGFRVLWPKGRYLRAENISAEHWTLHGQVLAHHPQTRRPFYWARGEGGDPNIFLETAFLTIDGEATTVMTGWDGADESLEWIGYDVTALPYHARRGGDVAVIGVGGGRDLLTALWARSRSVTGIEINRALLDLLRGPYREFAGLVDRPEVEFVHEEARSYLTRTDQRFDVIQMSLIDTWAATGAGAFTLSENGLYTIEGWHALLGALRPDGILSVSRWFKRGKYSETSRLLSLATATLLERGATSPRAHLVLATRGTVATLLVSPTPFGSDDLTALRGAVNGMKFQALVAPGRKGVAPYLDRIVASRSLAELEANVASTTLDHRPPTDERPYFFNNLKPAGLFAGDIQWETLGAVARGNALATLTLISLLGITAALVAATILYPLARAGLPRLDGASFAHALLYFGLIGMGFMWVQIPLMQRFSVYLGHPTYTIAVTLFSMILASGVGSFISDRLDLETSSRWLRILPLGIAALLLAGRFSVQALIDGTIHQGLLVRCAIAGGFIGVLALPLGTCFPVGLRLLRRISDDATPWMWGVNGAAGVLASVTAVAVSIWSGISTSLLLGTLAYALLALPAAALYRRGAGGEWT
jgi:hypothetical protein